MKNHGGVPGSVPEASIRAGYKRRYDLTILILTHAVLLPVLLLLWMIIPVLIWAGDRGPIFFRQKRTGKNGRTISILKFRTMVADAESAGPSWTTEDDPRVTRFGRILRRTALDELPGVLSIWKGDMSLVGPRALELEEHKVLEQQIEGFADRLRVTPGLTGLAQVYDRADDARVKFAYDLEYIQHMGAWLDTRLLFLSALNTMTGRWDKRTGKVSKRAS